MPWTPSDASKHDKDADTSAKKRKWASIANSVLKSTGDDARAIRAASSKVESLSLADVVLDEDLKKRLKHALAVAMDTPERYGGPPPAKKPKKKPKAPLGKRLKRFATDAAHAMFPRVEGVEESLADKVREYADVSDSSHPWNKIARTLEKWGGDGGGSESSTKTAPSTPKRTELLKPKRKEPEKVPSASQALKDVIQSRRQARADRDREKQDRARTFQIGRAQPGTKAHTEKLRKQHAQRS